jgi:hypothetical protein
MISYAAKVTCQGPSQPFIMLHPQELLKKALKNWLKERFMQVGLAEPITLISYNRP